MSLKDKVVLVTGASRGIGKAIALACAKEGAIVCGSYQRNKAKANAVLDELNKIQKNKHVMLQFDVADAASTEKALGLCVEQCGGIDVLVNNAGITRDNLLLRMKEEEWTEVINVNLGGVFHCSKWAAKRMLKKKWGRIINIASVAGQMGNPGQTNYAASKAGMIGFTKSMAKELASRNITVNAIAPGFIETEMTDSVSASVKETMAKGIPVGRFGTCEDIAHLVIFLASEKAAYVTGQVIGVNGGLYM